MSGEEGLLREGSGGAGNNEAMDPVSMEAATILAGLGGAASLGDASPAESFADILSRYPERSMIEYVRADFIVRRLLWGGFMLRSETSFNSTLLLRPSETMRHGTDISCACKGVLAWREKAALGSPLQKKC
eukprot:4709813-Amphidinium_carterae.2